VCDYDSPSSSDVVCASPFMEKVVAPMLVVSNVCILSVLANYGHISMSIDIKVVIL